MNLEEALTNGANPNSETGKTITTPTRLSKVDICQMCMRTS